ncbi:MAG TPA: nucleotide-binding protein [Chloroflexota bacterium]|nr:nucleotide-binding protein [Chloroflexota bacterium]
MITAVDTNVLFDLLIPQAPRGELSERALTDAARAGALVVSEPVYAELAAFFPGRDQLEKFLNDTRIRHDPSSSLTLYEAGRAWRQYRERRPAGVMCSRCGQTQVARCAHCDEVIAVRQHVVADFIIGAHGLLQADRLLTHDRGDYATYFPDLAIVS